MLMGGDIGPTGEVLPSPTSCCCPNTAASVHEVVRADPPQVRLRDGDAARALPGEGRIAPNMRDYVVKQLKETVIPTLERGLRRQVRHRPPAAQYMRESQKAEDDLVAVLHSAKNRPSPIGRLLRRRLLHRPDLHGVPRMPKPPSTTAAAPGDRASACATGKGPVTPEGDMGEEKYRLVVEGPPNWTSFRDFWKDVLRRRRGCGVVDLRQGRRPVRLRLPPRRRPAARVAGEYCRRLYTNLNPAVADRHDLPVHRRVPGRRPADQLRSRAATASRPGSSSSCARSRSAPASRRRSSRPTSSIRAYFSAANVKNRLRATSDGQGEARRGRRRGSRTEEDP